MKPRPDSAHNGAARRPLSAPSLVLWSALALIAVCVPISPARSDETRASKSQHTATAQPATDLARASLPLAELVIEPGASQAADAPLDSASADALRRAQAQLEDDDVEGAIGTLDAALHAAPVCHFELLHLLAQANYRQGRHGAARVAAELAGMLRPKDPDVHYLLGRLYREQGRPAAAIAHYRVAAEHEPTTADDARVAAAAFELGEVLEQEGYILAAAQAYARFNLVLWALSDSAREADVLAAILPAQPRGTLERIVDLLAPIGQRDELMGILRAARDARPQDVYVQRLFIRTLAESGAADEAFEYGRSLLGAAGHDRFEALLTPALEAALASANWDAWRAELLEHADSEEGLARLADVAERLAALDRAPLAVPLWDALAKRRPHDAAVAWGRAAALVASGRPREALAALESGLPGAGPGDDHEPECVPAGAFDALLAASARGPDLAGAIEPLMAEASGSVAEAALLLLAAGTDRMELAQRLASRLAAHADESNVAALALARFRVLTGEWPAAIELLERLTATRPKLAEAHHLLGQARAGLDENDAAERAFLSALRLRPGSADELLALARHQRRVGDLLGAQRRLQEAWANGPHRGDVLEELVSAYLEGGKIDLAAAIISEAEEADVPAASLRRARTALRFAGRPGSDEHLAELTRQHSQHPDDVETGLQLASGLLIADRFDEAGPVLERLMPHGTQAERAQYLRTRLALRRLENARAIEILEPLATRYPRRMTTLSVLCAAQLADFRLDAARQTIERMIELASSPEQRDTLRSQLILSHVDFMEYDAALARLGEWLQSDPNDPTLQRMDLRVRLIARRYDEALALADERLAPLDAQFKERIDEFRAASLRGGGPSAALSSLERELRELAEQVYDRRGEIVEICMQARRHQEAVDRIRKWQEDEPGSSQLMEWLIEVLLADKQGDAAMNAIAAYVARAPADPVRATLWRARALALQDRVEDGVRELTALLRQQVMREERAARAQVRRELINMLVDDQDFQRALSLTEQWRSESEEASPRDQRELLTLQRFIVQAAERTDDHIEVDEKLLLLDPRDPGLNNDLGYSLADRGEQLGRALRMITLAVAAEPLNPAYLDSLGWVYYKLGQIEPATKYLERATRLRAGQDPIVYDHLGDAEYRAGRRDAARAAWETSKRLFDEREEDQRRPSDRDVLEAVQRKLDALETGAAPPLAPLATSNESGAAR